ncbi:MAG: recombinase RecB, partial [Rhodococcus sp. (in: high G+C Gram-positive bacteria)]
MNSQPVAARVSSGREPSVLIDAGSLTRCRHRLYLDTAYSALQRSEPENPGVRQRREAAQAHREAIRAMFAAELDGWVEIDAADARTASERTLAACRRGAEWIWNAVLPAERDTGRRGRSELLMRAPSGTGYIPIIVVNHKVTDPGRGAVTSPLT